MTMATTQSKKESAQPKAKAVLSKSESALIDAYWRAANYLSVGQIYLFDNPLLREPLKEEHIKPRLLGHWGTTPGLNFIYVHLNRMIKKLDLDMIYITGPGHGGPGLVANTYLEGTYSEVYPGISQDAEGMKRLFTQFSFPGGIPSHVAPETPGSIHEGGELGYALSHAYRRGLRQSRSHRRRVVGDGEAETGPLATSWHSNKFLNPVRDGAVLPILHLNGYKIANPTVLARISHEELESLFRGYGYKPHFVEGDDPAVMHELMAATLETVIGEIRDIQADARKNGFSKRPIWPMIVMRTPKGWTCPKEIDGKREEGYWRSHQVPMSAMRGHPEHVRILETWMKSYRPEELFDDDGRLKGELAALAPQGTRRMSANPHANGGQLLRDLKLPNFRDYAVEVPSPGSVTAEATRVMGQFLRDVMKLNLEQRATSACSARTRTTPTAGRTCSRSRTAPGPPRPSLTTTISRRRAGDGDAERAPVPGLARRLSADRPARLLLLLRGLHPHHRFHVQPACEMAEGLRPHPVATADRLAQLSVVEPRLASGPQRLFPPGSRLHRPCDEQEGGGGAGLSAA